MSERFRTAVLKISRILLKHARLIGNLKYDQKNLDNLSFPGLQKPMQIPVRIAAELQ